MTNNDIAEFFRLQMLAMLAEQGQSGVRVTSSFQTNNQGRLDGPVLYFVETGDAQYGGQSSTTKRDVSTGQVTDESLQHWRITYQVQGFAPDDLDDLSALTAADVVKLAMMLLVSPPFRRALKARTMGIEKIPTIKPNFVVNDRAQYEAGPIFEFTMSYRRSIIQKSAVIESTEFAIHRV